MQLLDGPDLGLSFESKKKSSSTGGNRTHQLASFCSQGMYSTTVPQLYTHDQPAKATFVLPDVCLANIQSVI